MSRAQKYHSRPRHLYALMFDNRHCYVGQTIALKRREAEHKRDWGRPFRMVHLGTIEGTQALAEAHEYAWRWKAHRAGWRNYGKNRAGEVFIISDPNRRMLREHHRIAADLKWPQKESQGIDGKRWLLLVASALLILTILRSLLV